MPDSRDVQGLRLTRDQQKAYRALISAGIDEETVSGLMAAMLDGAYGPDQLVDFANDFIANQAAEAIEQGDVPSTDSVMQGKTGGDAYPSGDVPIYGHESFMERMRIGMANAGSPWAGTKDWYTQGGQRKPPTLFSTTAGQEPFHQVRATGASDPGIGQEVAELTLGGLWAFVDTALLGIPGLLEWAGGKLGAWDKKGFGPWEGGEFIMEPETFAGRVGHGIGSLAGFMTGPLAPAKILKGGKALAGVGLRGAAKIPSKGKTVKALVTAARKGSPEAFAQLSTTMGSESAALKALGEGFKTVVGGKRVVSAVKGGQKVRKTVQATGAFEKLGVMKYPDVGKAYKSFEAVRRGGSQVFPELVKTGKGLPTGSRLTSAFFENVTDDAVNVVSQVITKEGVELSKPMVGALKNMIGEAITTVRPISNLSMKATNQLGAIAGHVAQRSIELGVGMASYKMLRHYVVDGIKQGKNPFDPERVDEAGKTLLSGMLDGALLGAVSSAVPNIGFKKVEGGLADWKQGAEISPNWKGKVFRTFKKFKHPLRTGRMKDWPGNKVFEDAPYSPEGRSRIFRAFANMRNVLNGHRGWRRGAQVIVRPELSDKFEIMGKSTLSSEADAKAALEAMRAMWDQTATILMQTGAASMKDNFARAIPRMITSAMIMNWNAATDKDMWKDHPEDLIFSMLTSAYIGYGGGWPGDTYNSSFAKSEDQVWARGMMELLGHTSGLMPSHRGPTGEKLGVWDTLGAGSRVKNMAFWQLSHIGMLEREYSVKKDFTNDSVKQLAKGVNRELKRNAKSTEQVWVEDPLAEGGKRIATPEELTMAHAGVMEYINRINDAHYDPNVAAEADSRLIKVGQFLNGQQIVAINRFLHEATGMSSATGLDNPSLKPLMEMINLESNTVDKSLVGAIENLPIEVSKNAGGRRGDAIKRLVPRSIPSRNDNSAEAVEFRKNYRLYANSLSHITANAGSHRVDPEATIKVDWKDLNNWIRQPMADATAEVIKITGGEYSAMSDAVIAQAGRSLERLGYNHREEFMDGTKTVPLMEPENIHGQVGVKEIDVKGVVEYLNRTGLLIDGAMPVMDKDTREDLKALGIHENMYETLMSAADLMVRYNYIGRTNVELKTVELTRENRVAIDRLYRIINDTGLRTTMYDNKMMELRKLRNAGFSVSQRELALFNMLADNRLIDKDGMLLKEPELFGLSAKKDELTGKYIVERSTLDEELSGMLPYDMYLQDVQGLLNSGLVRGVMKGTEVTDVPQTTRLMTKPAFVNMLNEVYQSEFLANYGENLTKFQNELGTALKRPKLDPVLKHNLGAVYGILTTRRGDALVRALSVFQRAGVFQFVGNQMKVNAEKMKETALRDTVNNMITTNLESTYGHDMNEPESANKFIEAAIEDAVKMHSAREGRDVGRASYSADIIRRLKLTESEHFELREAVQGRGTLKITNHDELKGAIVKRLKENAGIGGMRADKDARSQDVLPDNEAIQLWNAFKQLRRINQVTLSVGDEPSQAGPEAEATSVTTSASRTEATILDHPMITGIQDKYPGVEPMLVNTTVRNPSGSTSLHTDQNFELMRGLLTGTTRFSKRVGTSKDQYDVIDSEVSGQPSLVMMHTSRPIIYRLPSAESPESGKFGMKFLKDMASDLSVMDLKPSGERDKDLFKFITKVAGSDIADMKFYKSLIGRHVNRDFDGDLQKMFTLWTFGKFFGKSYIRRYMNLSTAYSPDPKELSVLEKVAEKRFSLEVPISNSYRRLDHTVVARELTKARALDPNAMPGIEVDPDGKVYAEVALFSDLKTNGATIMSKGAAQMWGTSIGHKDGSSTFKGELVIPADGTENSQLWKTLFATSGVLDPFMGRHGLQFVTGPESAPWLGEDVPVNSLAELFGSVEEFGTFAQSNRTKAGIKTIKVPIDKFVHYFTPSISPATQSSSNGLFQTRTEVLDYMRASVNSSGSAYLLERALNTAAVAENPQNRLDMRNANAYFRMLLNQTSQGEGHNPDGDYEQNWGFYAEKIAASQFINPMSPEFKNQSMNLIRKRLLDDGILKPKGIQRMRDGKANLTSCSAPTCKDWYGIIGDNHNMKLRGARGSGADGASVPGAGEAIGPDYMARQFVVDNQAAAYQDEKGEYQFAPLMADKVENSYFGKVGTRMVDTGVLNEARLNVLVKELAAGGIALRIPGDVKTTGHKWGFVLKSMFESDNLFNNMPPFSDRPMQNGRFFKVMDWAADGATYGNLKSYKGAYSYEKGYDRRQFRYGLSAMGQHTPKATPDDTLPFVIQGFNGRLAGNQVIIGDQDVLNTHQDHDGDKMSLFLDPDAKMLNALKGNIKTADLMHVTDDGVLKATGEQLVKPPAPNKSFDLLDAKSTWKYKSEADYSKRMIGVVLSDAQAMSELTNKGIKIYQIDEHGVPYYLRPAVKMENVNDTHGVSRYDDVRDWDTMTPQQRNWIRVARSGLGSRHAAYQQAFVSQPGKRLDPSMLPRDGKLEWRDQLIAGSAQQPGYFVRDYSDPALSTKRGAEKDRSNAPISGTDLELVRRVLNQFGNISGLGNPDYTDGPGSTKSWSRVIEGIRDFRYSRGKGGMTNQVMATILQDITGQGNLAPLESAILRAAGWEVITDTEKGTVFSKPKNLRDPRGIASILGELVQFTNSDFTSTQENVSDMIWNKYTQYKKSSHTYQSTAADREWMRVLNEQYFAENNPGLTTSALTAMDKATSTFNVDKSRKSIDYYRDRLKSLNYKLENARSMSASNDIRSAMSYYSKKLTQAYQDMPGAKSKDERVKKQYLLNPKAQGGNGAISSEQEGDNRYFSGLSWGMQRDNDLSQVANPEVRRHIGDMAEEFHTFRRKMNAGIGGKQDVMYVPANILEPQKTIAITANRENGLRMERIWMRQLTSHFVGAKPYADKSQVADPDVPAELGAYPEALFMSLAFPRAAGLEGVYRKKGGARLPIYRTPYVRALQFWQAYDPTADTTSKMEAIHRTQQGLRRGWITSDALALSSRFPGGVTPLDYGHYANFRMSRRGRMAEYAIWPGGHEQYREYNVRVGDRDAMKYGASITGEADQDQIGWTELNEGPPQKHKTVEVTLNREMLITMPVKQLGKYLRSLGGVKSRVIMAGTRAEKGRSIEPAAYDRLVNKTLSAAEKLGYLDLSEMPESMSRMVHDYLITSRRRTLPDPDWEHVKFIGEHATQTSYNDKLHYVTWRVEQAYGRLIEGARLTGNDERANMFEAKYAKIQPRLESLRSQMLNDRLLTKYYGDEFNFQRFVSDILGYDPLSSDQAVAKLDVYELQAIEGEYQKMHDGLKGMKGKSFLNQAQRWAWPSREIFEKTPETSRMYKEIAVSNRHFTATLERANRVIHQIETDVAEVTKVDGKFAMLSSLGSQSIFGGRLTKLTKQIEHLTSNLNKPELSSHQRKEVEVRLDNLKGRRDEIRKSSQYLTQEAIVHIINGVTEWDGNVPKRFESGQRGRNARRLYSAYRELGPVAGRTKTMLNEVGDILNKAVAEETDAVLAQLRNRLHGGDKHTMTRADRDTMKHLESQVQELKRISSYFPSFKPQAVKGLVELFNDIHSVVGATNNKTGTPGLNLVAAEVDRFFVANKLARGDFDPAWTSDLTGSLKRYSENVAAYAYKVRSEHAIRNTVDFFIRRMQSKEFRDAYGHAVGDPQDPMRDTRSVLSYIGRWKESVYGTREDVPLAGSLRVARLMATSKIWFSPITYLRQGSQKLLNYFVGGFKATRDAKYQLEAVESVALRRAIENYVPVGFAASEINEYNRIQRDLLGDPVAYSHLERMLRNVAGKGLKLLKDVGPLSERSMQKQLLSTIFVKTYKTLQASASLHKLFENGLFSDFMVDHYPGLKAMREEFKTNPKEYEKNVSKYLDEYSAWRAERVALESVGDIHFFYSQFAKPEAMRSPLGSAIWALRSYDVFHTALLAKAFSGVHRRIKIANRLGRDLDYDIAERANEVFSSPEGKFARGIFGAYALIGLAGMAVPAGLFSYFRPGTGDLIHDITGYVTGMWGDDDERRKARERLFFGKGLMTSLTGPVVSDMVDLINVYGAEHIGDPNEFLKFFVGFRDYRSLPKHVKRMKLMSKFSAEAARTVRDVGDLTQAAYAGNFAQQLPKSVFKHLGIGQGAEDYEKAASKGMATAAMKMTGTMPQQPQYMPQQAPAQDGALQYMKKRMGAGLKMPAWMKGRRRG